MTTQDQTPGEQPGQEAPVTPASEQPPAGDTPVNDLSADELLKIITEETPEAEAPPATPEPKTGEQPAKGDDDDEEQPPGSSKPPGRLSVRALPADQQLELAKALAMVREGEASDPFEALQMLRGANGQPDPKVEEDEADPEPQAQPAAVQTIEAKLAELREERKQAKRDFDTDEEERLTTEIEDTLISLQEAKMLAAAQKANEQQIKATYEDQYQSAVDELETNYPESLDDNSQFSRLLYQAQRAAIADNDPVIQNPRYLLGMAAEIKDLLQPKSGRPPSYPPPLPRPTGAALAPAHSQVERFTEDQARAIIYDADPDDLLAELTR
jgi:hypothetical protein